MQESLLSEVEDLINDIYTEILVYRGNIYTAVRWRDLVNNFITTLSKKDKLNVRTKIRTIDKKTYDLVLICSEKHITFTITDKDGNRSLSNCIQHF